MSQMLNFIAIAMWSYVPKLHMLFYLTALLIDFFLYIELLQCHLVRWSYRVLWVIVYILKPLTLFIKNSILSVIQVEKQKTMSFLYAILN